MRQEHPDALSMFLATVARSPQTPFIDYFGARITFKQADADADALAAGLSARGLSRGDRLGILTQNIPWSPIAVLAAWKLGVTAVPLNAMSTVPELADIAVSAQLSMIIVEDRYVPVAQEAGLTSIVAASPYDHQPYPDRRVLPPAGDAHGSPAVPRAADLVRQHRDTRVPRHTPAPGDAAFIVYTSGTTGTPKGAVNRHESVAFAAQVYREWLPLTADDVIIIVAPLSNVTGLIVGLANSLLTGAMIILTYRYDVDIFVEAVQRCRGTFLCGPATLIISILGNTLTRPEQLSSLRHIYCGGAPVAPVLAERWESRFKSPLRSVYGLTEATGPTHIPPPGVAIPVDPESGALAIGKPVFDTDVRLVDEVGRDVAPGESGEMLIRGPQVIHEYWANPAATEQSLKNGWLHTGDIAKADAEGWYYVVDRKKDIIIASGFNIASRQVEDVLLQHPGVREAGVIGVRDDYRGETVWAFVVTTDGAHVTGEELTLFCRDRLSAYKVPRRIEFVDSLPRNTNGKVMKHELAQVARTRLVTGVSRTKERT